MAQTPHLQMSPELSLPIIEPETVHQVEREPISVAALRDQFSDNPQLLYALRLQATKEFPNLPDREKAVRLALGMLRLTESQLVKNALPNIFSLEPTEIQSQKGAELPPAA